MMEGPSADSEEKHEPVSDIDTTVADSLKALDLNGRLEKLPYASKQIASLLDHLVRACEQCSQVLTYSRLMASRKADISAGAFKWCTRFEAAASATSFRYFGASRRSQSQTTL